MEEEMIISFFSLFSLCFFVSMASWDKDSFIIPFTWAYVSLLYLVAIPTKIGSKKEVSFKKKKKREKKEIHILFSSRRIFLACILWVQVQGKDHISDEDPLGHQNRQSHKQNLRQLEPDLGNDSPNQDTRILQNRQQENNHVDEIEGISQKEKRFKRMHDEMGFPISVVTTGLHPKGHQTWFPIQIQKQRSIMIFNHEKKKGV